MTSRLGSRLPTGTVVFLRSDIEGSMALVRSLGPRYDELDAVHRSIVRETVERHGGHVVRTEGDGFFAAFTDASGAVRAAGDIQIAMGAYPWPADHPFRVRIGLHAGRAYAAGDDYGGFEVSRAARIASMGWGGQIILSDPVRALVASDLPPGWALRDLGPHHLKGVAEPERVFQLDLPGLATTFDELRSAVDPSDRLPPRMTSVVGRERELEALDELFMRSRLLTLTGPGGSGKTTLALELARRHARDLDDGARFVDLQSVHDPGRLRGELARAVGLLDGPLGPAEARLDEYVANRAFLLVIDNFEQVISAAEVVADLLVASPRSRFIVTSRTPLRLRAEQEFPVRPMDVRMSGDREPEAVRLYIERARQVRPDLGLGDTDVEAVAEVCRLVDGLPLAIELCAARASSVPIGLIRDRLRERQPLPGAGPRDMPDRQRTIDATVAWSHDLLDPPLQRLFRRLAVFEESVELDQAELVCGPGDALGVGVLDGLMSLVDQSLLVRVDDAVGGVRFGWLETIRSHARDRLAAAGEAHEMRDRHRRAFAALAAEAGRHLPGADQGQWLDRLEADAANLRAATTNAIGEGDVDAALRLVGGLWRFWLQSGRLAEGREHVARALALPGADAPTALRVRALDAAGGLAYWAGDIAAADAIYEEELALAQRIGDRAGEALAWFDLFFTRELADVKAMNVAKQRAASIFKELGDDFSLERVEQSGFLTMLAGGVTVGPHGPDLSAILPELDARASAAEALGDRYLSRLGPALRGFACLARGEVSDGLRWMMDAQRANLAVRERTDAVLLMQLAVFALPMIDRADVAAILHGTVLGLSEQLGVRPPASYEELMGFDPLPSIREALGTEGFDAAVERGRRLSLEESVDLVDAAATPSGEGP